MSTQTQEILVVGAGKVGVNFARLFAKAGCGVTVWNPISVEESVARICHGIPGLSLVESVPPAILSFDVAYICVPDPQIPEAFATLDRWGVPKSTPALHSSGATELLGERELHGRPGGGAHPAMGFPRHDLALDSLMNLVVVLAGDPAAVLAARQSFDVSGVTTVEAPQVDRLAYHAACVLASNFTALAGAAAQAVFESQGISHEDAGKLCGSLMQGAVTEGTRLGFSDSLTGPAVRGDRKTVSREAAQLDATDPQLAQFYRLGSTLLERFWKKGQ